MDKRDINELRLWAKDDLVPSDLQKLCKQGAAELKHLKEIIENTKIVCADQRVKAKGQMTPERRCIERCCDKIEQVLTGSQ